MSCYPPRWLPPLSLQREAPSRTEHSLCTSHFLARTVPAPPCHGPRTVDPCRVPGLRALAFLPFLLPLLPRAQTISVLCPTSLSMHECTARARQSSSWPLPAPPPCKHSASSPSAVARHQPLRHQAPLMWSHSLHRLPGPPFFSRAAVSSFSFTTTNRFPLLFIVRTALYDLLRCTPEADSCRAQYCGEEEMALHILEFRPKILTRLLSRPFLSPDGNEQLPPQQFERLLSRSSFWRSSHPAVL